MVFYLICLGSNAENIGRERFSVFINTIITFLSSLSRLRSKQCCHTESLFEGEYRNCVVPSPCRFCMLYSIETKQNKAASCRGHLFLREEALISTCDLIVPTGGRNERPRSCGAERERRSHVNFTDETEARRSVWGQCARSHVRRGKLSACDPSK